MAKHRKTVKTRQWSGMRLFIAAAGLAAVGFVGFAAISGEKNTAALPDGIASGSASVVVEPSALDLGNVSMAEGIAERSFSVRNTGGKALKVTRLTTSCMCTTAQFEVGGKASPSFGMPGHGGASSYAWSSEVPPGGEGTLRVFYDPNAHGPAGVGPFEREIQFSTDDPEHERVAVRISGVVVK